MESILLKTHWVRVVRDQFSRRIVGFAVTKEIPTGDVVSMMFAEIIGNKKLPLRLSYDHDPLFKSHRWKTMLRVLQIKSMTSVPEIPVSHCFVERLIDSVRREFLDQIFYSNARDLKRKLDRYAAYFNEARVQYALNGLTPNQVFLPTSKKEPKHGRVFWRLYCESLFNVPIAA